VELAFPLVAGWALSCFLEVVQNHLQVQVVHTLLYHHILDQHIRFDEAHHSLVAVLALVGLFLDLGNLALVVVLLAECFFGCLLKDVHSHLLVAHPGIAPGYLSLLPALVYFVMVVGLQLP
jgi:hypothetical protein